jgi:hypothetical protein
VVETKDESRAWNDGRAVATPCECESVVLVLLEKKGGPLDRTMVALVGLLPLSPCWDSPKTTVVCLKNAAGHSACMVLDINCGLVLLRYIYQVVPITRLVF